MPIKIEGTPLATFNNLKIYANFHKPKTKGRETVWLSIRQDHPKKWRVATTLSYVNAMDIRFEKRNSERISERGSSTNKESARGFRQLEASRHFHDVSQVQGF